MRSRLRTLVPLERATVANLAKSQTYRRKYYESCFDSLVPISTNATLRSQNFNNVFLGVKRDKQGDCEGCPLKTPVRYNVVGRHIRKFVGNTEVFDIVTNKNGSHVTVISF